MTGDKAPKDRERDQLDLERENQALRTDLEIRGMALYQADEDLPPETEYSFLHHVEMMEDAMEQPFCKVRDLFPQDVRFPPHEQLDDEELEELVERIESTLAARQIYFKLNEAVPTRAIYRYFLAEVLEYDVLFEYPPEGFASVLDGCSGYCPGCFQRDYCESAQEYEDWDESCPLD